MTICDGNSFGHLVLHITGNLNYYIGAQLAGTGYVRNRQREFSEKDLPSKAATVQALEAAVKLTVETLEKQTDADWVRAFAPSGLMMYTTDLRFFCVAPSIFIIISAK